MFNSKKYCFLNIFLLICYTHLAFATKYRITIRSRYVTNAYLRLSRLVSSGEPPLLINTIVFPNGLYPYVIIDTDNLNRLNIDYITLHYDGQYNLNGANLQYYRDGGRTTFLAHFLPITVNNGIFTITEESPPLEQINTVTITQANDDEPATNITKGAKVVSTGSDMAWMRFIGIK